MADARVMTAINLMKKSVAEQTTMKMLSDSVNLSPAGLRQLFKKETGQSPIQYLRNLRLQRAEELLRDTFLSIKEVAFQCGSADVSHFVREFKKRHGRTPGEYRAESQQRTDIAL